MFWKKNNDSGKTQKLSGPRDIPESVRKFLVSTGKIDPDIIQFLKAVVRGSEKGDKALDIRIFDPADAEAREVKVKDYNTLAQYVEMIIAEGWYNDSAKQVELEIKKSIPRYKYLTYDEVLAQIEGLKEPGSSTFFFMAAGTGSGGPLGRGVAIVRYNNSSEKRQKKYSVFGASAINMQPSQNQLKIFDSDKSIEVAKWIAESQKPRFC